MENKKEDHLPEEEVRCGVYICRCGGNISDVIDVERVAEVAQHIPGVKLAKVNTFMCSDPGQATIVEDIEKENLNRILVASCSPTLHELTFQTAVTRADLNPYLYKQVNIREQGSWAHKSDKEGATEQAIRQVAAVVRALHHVESLERIELPNHQKALVLGGGIAGMKAASALARSGVSVILLESSQFLGGHAADLETIFPTGKKSEELIQELAKQVLENPLVEVLGNASLQNVSGFIGNFEVTISPGDNSSSEGAGVPIPQANTWEEITTTVGAVVVATGFRAYEPHEGEYGWKSIQEVVTLPDYVKMLANQKGNHLSYKGKTIRSVAFLHCVGSRQVEGTNQPQEDGQINPYCSRTCCTSILHNAVETKKRFPSVDVFDVHQDIRTYGRGHEDYYTEASNLGVIFFRFHGDEPPKVERDSSGTCTIHMKDWLTWGEDVSIPCDLVVLGVGMMPGGSAAVTDMLKLPVGTDRFLQEVHPKLAPVEVSVDGVFIAGTAQGPMNIEEALLSGGAAASKAKTLLQTETVSIDPFVAKVLVEDCTGCGACVSECVYTGALLMLETEVNGEKKTVADVNPGLCKGCGACVAVCPTRAIDLKGWTLAQYEGIIDALVEPAIGLSEDVAK